jgi:hypothetical protein
MTQHSDDSLETIRCAKFFVGQPRLALVLGSAERAIIVEHMAYRQAEVGGWFVAGIKGWGWLMPWRDDRSIRRDLEWLVDAGWIEKQEAHGKRSLWRLGQRMTEWQSSNCGQNVLTHPGQNVRTTADNLSGNCGQNVLTDSTGKNKESTRSASVLITEFYRSWFGDGFSPPNSTADEVALAVRILAAFDGDAEKACRAQASVVEALRKSFPRAERFQATEVAWNKKLLARKKATADADRSADDARTRKEAARDQASASSQSQAVYERTLPAWESLSDDERVRIRATFPRSTRGNKFFEVLEYADHLAASGRA